MHKVGVELLKQVEECEKQETQHEIPVLVTVLTDTDLGPLEQKGLRVRRIFDSISAIAGTLAAAEVNELAQMEQVVTIEYDGPVWALPGHVTDYASADETAGYTSADEIADYTSADETADHASADET